jgi:uncharacterized membrane protein YgdD (TMEM256/DUF423 family)
MSSSLVLSIASALGFIGVAFGAFGAHALKDRLDAYSIGVYQTGVQYLFWHLAPLLAIGVLKRLPELGSVDGRLSWAAGCFLAGTVIFSGSLWALALSGVRAWGAVTPVGGALFLAGWLTLLLASVRRVM